MLALLDLGAKIEGPVRKSISKNTPMSAVPGGLNNLAFAIYFADGDTSCVRLLLSRGADLRASHGPPFGTCAHLAGFSAPALMDLCLEYDPTIWERPHMMGLLPFEEFVMAAKPESARHVIEHHRLKLTGAPVGSKENVRVKFFATLGTTQAQSEASGRVHLLFRALLHIGDIEVLKMLLADGCDPNGDMTRSTGRNCSYTFLFLFRVLGFYTDHSRSPSNLADRFGNIFRGCSPLHLATHTGNLGAVKLLLEHGARADSTMQCKKRTPLHFAGMYGHEEIAATLLASTATAEVDLAGMRDARGWTAARWAKWRGHCALAERLKAAERARRVL